MLSSLPRHHNNPLAKCGCKKHCMDFHMCSRTVCYRIPRTLMRICVLLPSAKLTAIGNKTLTIRTFLFSPPS